MYPARTNKKYERGRTRREERRMVLRVLEMDYDYENTGFYLPDCTGLQTKLSGFVHFPLVKLSF